MIKYELDGVNRRTQLKETIYVTAKSSVRAIEYATPTHTKLVVKRKNGVPSKH